MNYISHLTAVIDQFAEDSELNPTHVSLYLALFYLWNMNHFKNPISVNRSEVRAVSKIGSKTTYHKCLWDLDRKKYLKYHPSHNSMKGSLIDMSIFGTTSGTSTGTTTGQVVGQVLVPSLNNTNTINNKKNTSFYLPSMVEIKEFFQNDIEAEKYFNYYSSKGWVVGNKSPMKDWKAAARNWLINSKKFNSNSKPNGSANLSSGHLHVEQDKDYNVPL